MRDETERLLREFQHKILTRLELNQLRLTVIHDFEQRGLPRTILKEWAVDLDEHLRVKGFLTSDAAYDLVEMLEDRCQAHLRCSASIAVSPKPTRKKRSHREVRPSE